ncbi:MAG: SusC/RagA family TonB-linked outer membrane protein [Chitinophagaceae bacterium]
MENNGVKNRGTRFLFFQVSKIFLIRKELCFFLFIQPFFFSAFAQTAVTGSVSDSKGTAISGVTITTKGGTKGVNTDAKGQFSITVADLKGSLVFTHVGFKVQEIALGNKNEINVMLDEDPSKLDEVVVIGYGKQSRELLTTSVSKLDTKNLENVSYTNVSQALQGALPGVRVQTTSGEPGAASRVIVRGGTSINNPNGAAPLYIVDGVFKDGGLTDINANDIESLQVLKDAASTAIYGARGSNGVVIVTTKSGRSGRTSFTYSYGLTGSKPGKVVEYASARDYIQYNRLGTVAAAVKNAALLSRNTQAGGSGTGNNLTNATAYTTMYLTPDNQFKLSQGWESMPDPLDPTKTIIFKDTKFSDLIYQNALTQEHNFSASGGTDKATFNAALGYLASDGTVISTKYKRLSFNLNGSIKLRSNIVINGRLLYTNRSNSSLASYANILYRGASLPGTAKYAFEDSTLAPGQSQSIGNPDYFLKGQYALQGNTNVEGTTMVVGGRWDIIPGLSFEPQISLFRANSDLYRFQPAALLNGVGAVVTTRASSASYSKTTQYQADGVLTYAKSIADNHHLEVKAGISYYSKNLMSQSAAGQGAATDNIPTLNAAAQPTAVSGQISDLRIAGLFSRIDYDYKEKYLLSLNYRYDGASNLGSSNKFGSFPGISAGWNLHKEKFWDQLFPRNLLTFKIRGSYGINGNISGLGDFQALGNYSVGSQYSSNAAVLTSVLPNADLSWEKSKTIDVGFDAGLFDRRVSFIFDYYRRTTDDLLTTVSLPASSGYSTVFTNLGSLENTGYEMAVDVKILPPSSKVQWSLSLNAAKVESQIQKLPANGVDKNRIGGVYVWDPATAGYAWLGGLQEGGRVGDMYAYKLTGVYATDADAVKGPVDNIVNTANKTKYGGDAMWADIDKNNIIDSRDQVYVGNPYPKWTGGISSYLSYKDLSLFVRADYTVGATVYNYPAVFADGQLQGDALPTKRFIDNMWKKQGDIANTPRYVWQNQTGNIRPNNTYYEKGDFLAIREITLAYSLPKPLISKIRASNVNLNLTGSNLHYFTAYTGQVPDDGGQDNGHYPIPVNLTFAIRVTF